MKYYQCFVVLGSLITPHSHRERCCREHRVYFKCSLNAVPLWLYLIKVSRARHQSLSSGLSGFDWPCLLLFNVRWQAVEVSMPPSPSCLSSGSWAWTEGRWEDKDSVKVIVDKFVLAEMRVGRRRGKKMLHIISSAAFATPPPPLLPEACGLFISWQWSVVLKIIFEYAAVFKQAK